MRNVLIQITLVSIVLAIPVVPFLVVGGSLERAIESRLDERTSPAGVAVVVIGLLAGDVLLPVPSSVVSTFAGNRLGLFGGAAASWLGMMAGAIVAYLLARVFGRPLAAWLSDQQSLQRTEALSRRFGPAALVLARPVPVLAEASVLYLGAAGLSWRRFLLPVALSNLGIALAYALLGQAVALPIALAAAVALPLTAAIVARACWPSGVTDDET